MPRETLDIYVPTSAGPLKVERLAGYKGVFISRCGRVFCAAAGRFVEIMYFDDFTGARCVNLMGVAIRVSALVACQFSAASIRKRERMRVQTRAKARRALMRKRVEKWNAAGIVDDFA